MRKQKSEQRKKPNCKPENFACGLKCQSKAYKCPSEKSQDINVVSDKFVSILPAVVPAEPSAKPAAKPEPAPKPLVEAARSTLKPIIKNSHQQVLLDFAKGKNAGIDKLKVDDKEINEAFEYGEEDLGTLQEIFEGIKAKYPEITDSEAKAIALWKQTDYEEMNAALHSPVDVGERYLGEQAGIRAAQGLRKLPPYSPEEVRKHRSKGGDRVKTLPDGKATRVLSVPAEDVEAFLKPYLEAEKANVDFREPTFFATSVNEDPYLDKFNVKYEINLRTDNKSNGKYISEFLENDWEGEVIFPPYTKFTNIRVERKGNQIIIKMDEEGAGAGAGAEKAKAKVEVAASKVPASAWSPLPKLVLGSKTFFDKFKGKLLLSAVNDAERFNARFLNKAVNDGFDEGLLLSQVTSALSETKNTLSTKENSKLLATSEAELKRLVDMNIPVNGRLLGKGEYGAVYLASVAGEEYAVKEGKIPAKEVEILNYLKEKKIKNVVRVIAVGELVERENIFGKVAVKIQEKRRMVMNRVKGVAAHELNAEQKKKVRKSPQIFKLVKEIHEAGVAHGDLHNGNIFVEENGEVNLIDFGLAAKDASNREKYEDMAKLVNQRWENQNEKELLEFLKEVLGLDVSVDNLEEALWGVFSGGKDFNRALLFDNPEIFKKFQEIYFKGY